MGLISSINIGLFVVMWKEHNQRERGEDSKESTRENTVVLSYETITKERFKAVVPISY